MFQQAGLAFLEGVWLILSPCILPILPIVLATSLTGGRRRPIGIIIGFILSFTLFALLARQLLSAFVLESAVLQNTSLILLIVLGVSMLIPAFNDWLALRMKSLANWGDHLSNRFGQGDGLRGGIMIGSLIGLIWAPCAGPVMAVALVQIIQAKTDLLAASIVLMFVTGAAVPMLIIALTGRQIMQKLGFLKNHALRLRQALGLVIIGAGLLLYSGVTTLLLASGGTAPEATNASAETLRDPLASPVAAPEFTGIQQWLNSAPLTMAGLKGKVVLIDFWTYSCINCIRTLPYVTAWDRKYRDKGLVIVGVHAPEFEFEKKPANVQKAIKVHNIQYPVALDNTLATWSAFQNRYWPAHYLINRKGQVVYVHFGEGKYDVTEHNIRVLLDASDMDKAEIPAADIGKPGLVQSPETYLGYARADNFSSKESMARDQSAPYSYPEFLLLNHWALQGQWQIGAQNITAQATGAKLRYNFIAGRVFLVLGTTDGKPLTVKLTLNGKPVGDKAGKDAANGVLTVSGETLYELINQHGTSNGILELEATAPGLQAYAFTFGG